MSFNTNDKIQVLETVLINPGTNHEYTDQIEVNTIGPQQGGTGIDTSNFSGIPTIKNGVWSATSVLTGMTIDSANNSILIEGTNVNTLINQSVTTTSAPTFSQLTLTGYPGLKVGSIIDLSGGNTTSVGGVQPYITNLNLNNHISSNDNVHGVVGNVVGTTDTQTLTDKTLASPLLLTLTISTILNTGTLTLPTTTSNIVGDVTINTLTNKTLTSPVISTILNTGTLTLPTTTCNIVGDVTTNTLTNKTLTSPIISTILNTGTLTLPTTTSNIVGDVTTNTLTNKTMSGSANTFSNIPYTALTGTPSFSTLTLTGTTNQLTLGTSPYQTIVNASAPAANRTYTIPDAGANSNLVLTAGNNNQTISMATNLFAILGLSTNSSTYTTGTITQSGTTVTGTGTNFTSSMVGGLLYINNYQQSVVIVAFNSTTSLVVGTSLVYALGSSYTIYYNGTTTGNQVAFDVSGNMSCYNLLINNSLLFGASSAPSTTVQMNLGPYNYTFPYAITTTDGNTHNALLINLNFPNIVRTSITATVMQRTMSSILTDSCSFYYVFSLYANFTAPATNQHKISQSYNNGGTSNVNVTISTTPAQIQVVVNGVNGNTYYHYGSIQLNFATSTS